MVELERSKCMVKARCYAKFLPPSFGGSAASFSGNYGFYAEIHGLTAQGGEKLGVFTSRIKEALKEKLSYGVSANRKTDEMAVACQAIEFQRLTG
jgi:hypothetical protein